MPYERIPYFQEIHNTDVHNDNLHSWRTGRYNPVFPDHAGRNIRRSRIFNGRRHRYPLGRSHADLRKPCLANTLRIHDRAIQNLRRNRFTQPTTRRNQPTSYAYLKSTCPYNPNLPHLRRSTQIHPTISKMVLRQRTEIRLNHPIPPDFFSIASKARDSGSNVRLEWCLEDFSISYI